MSTLRANNIANAAGNGLPGFNGVAGNRLTPSAWVNFNGSGTVAIRDAHNVASITDNGVGNYTVNFTTPMANANYVQVGSARGVTASNGGWVYLFNTSVKTVTQAQLGTAEGTGAIVDSSEVTMLYFGGF